ncbi:MAG: energy transducer TonB [Bacteroidaceae bacterium]|nr:energy transducer TonB [Bacteroidaceae bacterium]
MVLYILKSAITMALLYSCFFLFLSKETFHRFNRCMLVGIMLVSLIMPMFNVTTSHPTALNEEVYLAQNYMQTGTMEIVIRPTQVTRFTWIQLLSWIYLAGVAIMLIVTLVQAFSLSRFLHTGVRHTDAHGNTVILHNQDVPPFSIFRYIVMSVKDYEENRPYILTHEQEHIRLGHTYDLLLLEVMKHLQWFSPFIWLLSRDLKAVHEYEADQAVINQGIDAKSYQQLLVTKVVGDRLQPFTNNLNHGSLKKRIIMMYQKKSNRWLMLKALCAIPVAALTISVFATPIETDPVEDMVKTLKKTAVPTLTEVKESILTEEVSTDDNTPFAIHPVADQYGRIMGFTHEGKPAEGYFECTAEYVFIDGRQATEAELRNYKTLLANSKFEILKTANGTAKYDYKDKHGIIVIHTQEASAAPDGDEPLILVNGREIKFPTDSYKTLNDETIAKFLNIKPEDVQGITVLKDGAATAIYGDKGKNGVIEIKVNPDAFNMKEDQAQKTPGDEVFDVCEEVAAYPGGQGALMQYIATTVKYPTEAAENGIQGRMLVQFIVEKDGSLSNYEIVRNAAANIDGILVTALAKTAKEKIAKGEEVEATPEQLESCSKALEDEAIRVVKGMPKWEPAKQRGNVVRMKYTLPITFRLQ